MCYKTRISLGNPPWGSRVCSLHFLKFPAGPLLKYESAYAAQMVKRRLLFMAYQAILTPTWSSSNCAWELSQALKSPLKIVF